MWQAHYALLPGLNGSNSYEQDKCTALHNANADTLSLKVPANLTPISYRNSESLLLDIEDIFIFLQRLWCVDILMDSILSLQPAIDSAQLTLQYNLKVSLAKKLWCWRWDSDSEDKMMVLGCEHIFEITNICEACKSTSTLWEFIILLSSYMYIFFSSS